MLPSEVPTIDVVTATAMCKVQVRQFVAATRKWNWWCHDFEVAMMGAAIPQQQWVAVLPSHLDDTARDAYEELMDARRGNQTIPWNELTNLFEARFQENINPNNALLMLKALKFDRNKDDFTAFSTKFLDLVSKGYHAFDPAALDFVAPSDFSFPKHG